MPASDGLNERYVRIQTACVRTNLQGEGSDEWDTYGRSDDQG